MTSVASASIHQTSNHNSNGLLFVTGNEYRQIPDSQAVYDRSGNFPKVHDVTMYLDVLRGDVNMIERVAFDLGGSFQPTTFTCSCPVPVHKPNGTQAWRFSTRQQVYGGFTAKIRIRGSGGTIMDVTETADCSPRANTKKHKQQTFVEPRAIVQPLRMSKLADSQQFGVELELTSAAHMTPQDLVHQIPFPITVVSSYGAGKHTYNVWKIVPDGSIACSPHEPSCNTFELVSPVLKGGNGLSEVAKVLNALPTNAIQVNKSMGLHVHVDVSALSVPQLVKVCQQFIKYEGVMDSLLPPSRRTGSAESNRYFQSNRSSVGGSSVRRMLDKLAACHDIDSLVHTMNRDGRYYKLNLQNLATGRQTTVEFRQHSSSAAYTKVSAWIRFCVAFVVNSAKLKAPQAFAAGRTLNEQFEALFMYVIKDRALKNFYVQRRQELGTLDSAVPCCADCAAGGSCRA